MMLTLTDAQSQAIYTHDRCVAVSAGAGSGKTFILVQRYLALLEANPTWQLNQIVAITFTKKAAAEMRDRVRSELLQKAQGEASDGWRNHLNQIDSARIETIHGLCTSILRANAADIGIDPQFSVLEDADAILLKEAAVDDALHELNGQDHPALTLFNDYDGRTIRELLYRHLSTPLESQLSPEALISEWSADWERDLAAAFRQFTWDETLSQAVHWQPDFSTINLPDLQAQLWQDALPHLQTLIQQTDIRSCYESLVFLGKQQRVGVVGSAKNWANAEDLETAKRYMKALNTFAKHIVIVIGAAPDKADERAAVQLAHWLSALFYAQTAYRHLKSAREALDFDDLETLTRDLLNNENTAARYDGVEYQHVMVDEFQDTSAAQWEIVQKIANPARAGALFIVGDPKQSIYRFRGADPTVFDQAQKLINAHGGLSATLDQSFRTHAPLVSGFNALFSTILTRDENHPAALYQSPYGSAMNAARQNPPVDSPALELILFDEYVIKETSDDEANAENRRRWEAGVLAERLSDFVRDERPIYDKAAQQTRPVTCGDIALLFRAMSHAPIYEDALREAGIPFISMGGKSYYRRPEVWDIINLLSALHNPADDLALASALRSPLFSISDDALLALRLPYLNQRPMVSLWDALYAENWIPDSDVESIAFARNCLHDLRGMAGRISIPELLHIALNETGYLATLTALPDGARRRANVEKLVQQALKTAANGLTLGGFVHYLHQISELELRESEAPLNAEGVVQLMTVHGSKGLEFPIVVLVDAGYTGRSSGQRKLFYDTDLGWGCDPGGLEKSSDSDNVPYVSRRVKWLEEQRDDAESRRLLYVAATRAQDMLIVSAEFKAKNEKRDTWVYWLHDTLAQGTDIPAETGTWHEMTASWGNWRLFQPLYQPNTVNHQVSDIPNPPFNLDAVSADVSPPLLIAPVPLHLDAPAYSMTATSVADLGSALYGYRDYRPYYRGRWRQQVLRAAPRHIERVTLASSAIPGRVIGEIVHRALHWREVNEAATIDLDRLKCYAWELGIVRDSDQTAAVKRAQSLMENVLSSDIEHWIDDARQVYRELPFIFNTDQRTIYGVIDVLIQRQDGTWAIIDYKTTYVPWRDHPNGRDAAFQEHVHGYTLQMGVYAAAACELLELTDIPVYIHYIRHKQTVQIVRQEWQSALNRLEDHIGSLIFDRDDEAT
jgi:ATP-dependent helicase/nuclease subunit A